MTEQTQILRNATEASLKLQRDTMKAFVQSGYGSPDALRPASLTKPAPAPGEVLVRVRAAGVNPYDWHLVRGTPYIARLMGNRLGFGLRGPKHVIRGFDLAGEVEAVGDRVTGFKPGDEVFGWSERDGAFAECVSVSQEWLAPMPDNLTFEQAAAIPLAGLTALQALRDHGRVEKNQKVLVNGASGGVGLLAVQIAKSMGAHVTGVCSARNLELVRTHGADHVIDYTTEDFTRGSDRYDLIIDAAASRSLRECRRVLRTGGTHVDFAFPGGRWVGGFGRMLTGALSSLFTSQKVRNFVADGNKQDLLILRELAESGELIPVIDRTYSLDEVPDAIRYVESGHARGKVVVTV
jgi:NADPH:quinone reductase-like Zn-dependent oxidoreductase